MKMKNILSGCALAGTMCLLGANNAGATLAYDFPGTLPGDQTAGVNSLGSVFTVNSPIFVTGLGAFDSGGNGIGLAGVQVAIFSVTLGTDPVNPSRPAISSGTLVVNPVTFSGQNQPLVPGTSTRLAPIAPVTLNPGTYMVVANNYGPGGAEVNWNAINPNNDGRATATTGGGLLSHGSSFYNIDSDRNWQTEGIGASGWRYDVGASEAAFGGGTPGYAAGNFDFTPVPEASEFALAGIGLLGVVFVGRNMMLRRKTA